MPSRNELNARARAQGLDPATYVNDSKLEQKVLYLEKFATAITGALATGTLTSDATASADGDTTVVGNVTYTWKTALSEATATSTLTTTGTTPTDGDWVVINGRRYVFQTTLTALSTDQVLTNGSAANALTNLKKAINLTGVAGTDYGSGMVINPDVTAGALGGTTLVVSAKSLGTYANTYVTKAVSSGTTLSWTGTTLAGGVNPVVNQVLIGVSAAVQLDNLKDAINNGTIAGSEGTTYSTGTKAHTQVTATTNSNTQQVVQAVDYAVTNGDISTTNPTATGSHLSWGATTLASGTANAVAAAGASTKDTNAGIAGDKNI